MRILVLGAGGMAGHVVSLYLRENGFTVDTLSASHALDKDTYLVDVTDATKFKNFLDSHEYDAIVNCIGLLIKKSEERKDLAAYLNAYLPHFLENNYKDTRTKLIHLSTDCVFSGKNPPYKEDSPCDGELFYDRSKALGEIINPKDLTFRMSIIGPDMNVEGIGLFNWFYSQTGEVEGYTGAIWSGVTTIELAKAIRAAIGQELMGLYQLVPDASISKFDLLKLIKEVFNRDDINLKPVDKVALDKTLVNTRQDFNFRVGGYRQMLLEMKDWIDAHEAYYKHYAKEKA